MRTVVVASLLGLACASQSHRAGPYSANCQPLRRGATVVDTTIYDTTQVTTRPQILGGPLPLYPDRPREQGVQGRVVMALIIGPDGRVEAHSVTIVQRLEPQLDRAAVNWVYGTYYQPACVNNVPVRVRVRVPLDYRISGRR